MIHIDEDIITQCQNGDKSAFRMVVQTYQRMIFSLSLKMTCDEEEAKDIVQDTFLRVWQNIGRYDSSKNFTTWIYSIATHLCIDRLKKIRRLSPLPEDETAFHDYATNVNAHNKLENSQWVSIIRILAHRLSTKQRLVFTLCQLEGLSSEEVQQITGFDAKQIKSNLYLARQTIRQQLKKLGYE